MNKISPEKDELEELVDFDGSFSNSKIPIHDPTLSPTKTMDQTVAMTRMTNDPVTRGYRVYYGESEESNGEPLVEIDQEGTFGNEETENLSTYSQASQAMKELGVDDPIERDERVKRLGFDPKLDKELKIEKKRGRCKKCFTKRRLVELSKEKVDEILITKKNKDKDIVKKSKEEKEDDDSVMSKLLIRNIEAIKRLADKENISIEKLVKHLKQGE